MRGCILFSAIIAMVILLPSPIGATDTRVETLGASALFLKDEDNIWYFPASLLQYPNLLVMSLGGRASELTPQSEFWASGTYALPRGMVLGVAFGADEKQVTYAPLAAEEQLHLFWGIPAGSRGFGLRFSRFGAINNRVPSYEKSVSVTQVIAGIESESGAGDTVEAALAYCGTNFKDISNGEKRSEPKGYYELGFRMRNTVELTNTVRIIPVVTATIGARGARFFSSGQASESDKEDYFSVRIGTAYEIARPEDFLVIFHASILYDRTETSPVKTKDILWDLPRAGLGVEKWIRPWIALRAGAILRLQLRNFDGSGEGSPLRQTRVSTAQTIGLALRIDALQVDFAVEPELLKEGLYFMSGMQAPLFTKVTIRYNF
ncbi:MAG: hypothetical protein ACETWG_06170 [Candidatus Neomarinimicrobiota bacterium]